MIDARRGMGGFYRHWSCPSDRVCATRPRRRVRCTTSSSMAAWRSEAVTTTRQVDGQPRTSAPDPDRSSLVTEFALAAVAAPLSLRPCAHARRSTQRRCAVRRPRGGGRGRPGPRRSRAPRSSIRVSSSTSSSDPRESLAVRARSRRHRHRAAAPRTTARFVPTGRSCGSRDEARVGTGGRPRCTTVRGGVRAITGRAPGHSSTTGPPKAVAGGKRSRAAASACAHPARGVRRRRGTRRGRRSPLRDRGSGPATARRPVRRPPARRPPPRAAPPSRRSNRCRRRSPRTRTRRGGGARADRGIPAATAPGSRVQTTTERRAAAISSGRGRWRDRDRGRAACPRRGRRRSARNSATVAVTSSTDRVPRSPASIPGPATNANPCGE